MQREHLNKFELHTGIPLNTNTVMTNATTNVIARVAAVAAGFGLVAASFAPIASAATASTTTTTTTSTTSTSASMYTRNLTIGSTGADVTMLQNMLIGKGFTIAAGATGYFGMQTKAALAKFQASVNIMPAVGYFGPITRAKVMEMGGSTTTTTGGTTTTSTTLKGDEANLSNFDLRSEDGTGNESETDVKLATARFDVRDGDVEIQRAELLFDATGASTLEDKPWQFFDKITVMSNGKEIGSMNSDNRSDWNEEGTGTNRSYTISISGLKNVVREGDKAELTFAADINSNIDTADLSQKFNISVIRDGIRAVDAKGIQQYTGDTSDTVSFGFNSEENGDLSIRENDNDPDAAILVAKDNNQSDEFTVFKFNIRNSDDADSMLNEITLSASTSSSTLSVANVINKATLSVGSEKFDGDIGSSTINFDNMDATLDGNETTEVTLMVRLLPQLGNYAANGVTLDFGVKFADVDAEGANSGDNAKVVGSQVSAQHKVLLSGVDVAAKSAASTVTTVNTVSSSFGTYTIKYDVTAIEDDAFIATTTALTGTTAGNVYSITGGAFVGTNTGVITSNATLSNGYYKVAEGSTKSFTLTVTLDPTATGTFGVELTRVNFANTATTANASFTADSNNQKYETDPVTIPN